MLETIFEQDTQKYEEIARGLVHLHDSLYLKMTESWSLFVTEFNKVAPLNVTYSFNEFGVNSPILSGYTRIPKWMPEGLMDICASAQNFESCHISTDLKVGYILNGYLSCPEISQSIYMYHPSDVPLCVVDKEKSIMQSQLEHEKEELKSAFQAKLDVFDYQIFDRTYVFMIDRAKYCANMEEKTPKPESYYMEEEPMYREYDVVALDVMFIEAHEEVHSAFCSLVEAIANYKETVYALNRVKKILHTLKNCN